MLLWLLVALTSLAAVQRAVLIWRPAQAISLLSSHPAGLELALLLVQPPSITPDGYQLAALVQRQAPSWRMNQRQLVNTRAGTVAIGGLASGLPSLQTCLMATGRAAVTFAQMRAQVLRTAPRSTSERLQAAIAAVLVGRPLRQRDCLLVLMHSRAAAADSPGKEDQLERLLQAWNSLQPALQPLRPR